VTVCGNARETCPALPAKTRSLHWPVDDPAHATGDEDTVMATFRRVRDDLRRRVEELAVSTR